MKAIVTKYYGPTNTRGGRFIATADGGHRITVSYDYSLNSEGNHIQAAEALCRKVGWADASLLSGYMPDGRYAHVLTR